MSEILQTFLLAMTPVGELRVAIPVGMAVYHLNWAVVYSAAVIGNLTPVVFLLLFLEPVSQWLSKKSRIFQRFFTWLFGRTRRKIDLKRKGHSFWALMAFVAVPLPLTGGWTGSVVAFLLKMSFKKALPAIAGGVAIAGIIVVAAVKAGIAVERYFGWTVLLAVLLLFFLAYLAHSFFRKPPSNF